MAIREGLGGRRLAAVGAGVMLIGTLGAGPAFAGTASSGDYDYDYYSSYKCDDYKYSSYFKYGYWYDKQDGRDKPDDKPTTPQLPTDPDLLEEFLKGLSSAQLEALIATLSSEQLADLRERFPNLPGLPVEIPVQDIDPDPPLTPLSLQDDGAAANATPPAGNDDSTNKATPPPASNDDTDDDPPASPSNDAEPPTSNSEQSNVQESSEGPLTLNSSTSRLDDPKDDEDDKGEWRRGKAKYSYTSYKCYKNVEKGHYWYDYRQPGKVEATKVRTVPKGGVDTGN